MTDSKSIAWKSALQACSIFSSLSESDMHAVLDITTPRSAKQGEYLFREGEPVSGFFLVRVGAISIQRTTPSGKEKVIHVFRSGDTFGEAALVMDQYPADALAVCATELLHFSRSGYVKLLETKRDFALRTIASINQHMRQLVDHIEKDTEIEAPCRVANWLLDRCGNPNTAAPCKIELKVQKAALADELHMRNETLSRSFKKLSESGFISVQGSDVLIENPKEMTSYVADRYQKR